VNIAVASGKGGTGKTTVATNLAYVASRNGQSVAYLDCDVEEPNGHIFLKPQIARATPVGVRIPRVDEAACTRCGRCGDICQYSAIVPMDKAVLVFPELCNGCGACSLACPAGAIREVLHETGVVEVGSAGAIGFVHGRLKIGQARATPVVRAVRQARPEAELAILDAPPGTSCPVIESVRGCDLVVLVTEPTPFGLHDLKLAVEMVRAVSLPFAVVVNRSDVGDGRVRSYCDASDIDVLAEVADDRRIATAYSRGEIACAAVPDCEPLWTALLERTVEEAGRGASERLAG
jgi:MinD superfamily P-loop ATPase